MTLVQVIFYALLPVILFAPPRWALLAWLITTNLDATGPSRAVNSSFGWINALKAVGLPALLLFRMRRVPSLFWKSLPVAAWVALIGYASVAMLWSSYPLAAMKIVGNMIGILLAILALEKFARSGFLDVKLLQAFVVCTLLLGVLQTAVYQGTVFGFDGANRPARFTSFVAAQQYAALLVALLAAIIWLRPQMTSHRYALLFSLLAAIYFNGSRAWFVGAVLVIGTYTVTSRKRTLGIGVLGCAAAVLLGLMVVGIDFPGTQHSIQPDSRIVTTLSKLFNKEQNTGTQRIRNLPFRLSMDKGVLDALSAAATWQVVFGHGTSNGGEIPQAVFPRNYSATRVDPNRSIHNEWLRVLYEWGLVGLLLWCVVFLGLTIGTLRISHSGLTGNWAKALLAYLPALVLALGAENILAGAGTAVTIGFSILAAGLACRPSPAIVSMQSTFKYGRPVAWPV